MRRRLCALLLPALLLAGAAGAAPFVPKQDDEVVERLPARGGAEARRQRMALARDPRQLPLALASAQAALQRARRDGDPRELGAAQAALAPWWTQADAPPAVRLLRATLRQSAHEFDAALADLEALVNDPRLPPGLAAQAGLTRAAVLQVGGRLAEADAACAALLAPRFAALGAALSLPALACRAELRSLRGDAAGAAQQLDTLQRQAPQDRWLALLRAEAAQRRGDAATAETAFRLATAADADVYAIGAFADWLLEQGRAHDALALLRQRGGDADALLLREAIARRRLGDTQATALRDRLAARFAAAHLRGGSLHLREEARLALELDGDAAAAWRLARRNWQLQREVADAVLLARAARAAGQPEAAAMLRAWLDDPAAADQRLARLLAGAAA
ncbi:MAG: hypothetical protein U1F56_03595 [Rubrivivax sp.]